MGIPENMCANNDLSVICSMTEHYGSTTPTSSPADFVEYTFIHVPFFVWIIVFSVLIFLFNRFIIEILIRLRRP